MEKYYISAQQLLDDALELGIRILDSGFRPDFLVAIWRGGTPVGIAVHELLSYFGVDTDHIAIKTSLYNGIDSRNAEVQVLGAEYLEQRMQPGNRILLIDDVFDTGLTIRKVIRHLHKYLADNRIEIRVAAPYYKPANNRTDRQPDYFLHSTNRWLVFPHELVGLDVDEILAGKSGMTALKQRLMK